MKLYILYKLLLGYITFKWLHLNKPFSDIDLFVNRLDKAQYLWFV